LIPSISYKFWGLSPRLDKASREEAPEDIRKEDVRQGKDEGREKDERTKDGRKDVRQGKEKDEKKDERREKGRKTRKTQ